MCFGFGAEYDCNSPTKIYQIVCVLASGLASRHRTKYFPTGASVRLFILKRKHVCRIKQVVLAKTIWYHQLFNHMLHRLHKV